MLYSMCTYLHSFLDRNPILCSRFGHWEIIQQSLNETSAAPPIWGESGPSGSIP